MPQFEGSTGSEFIALQLALDFEDFDNPEAAAKADKEPKQKPESAAAAPGVLEVRRKDGSCTMLSLRCDSWLHLLLAVRYIARPDRSSR